MYYYICFFPFNFFISLFALEPAGINEITNYITSFMFNPSYFSSLTSSDSSFYCSDDSSSFSFILSSASYTDLNLVSALIFLTNLSAASASSFSSILYSHASLTPFFLLNTKNPSSSMSPMFYSYRMWKGSIALPKYSTCFCKFFYVLYFDALFIASIGFSLKFLSYSSSSSSNPSALCLLRR